MNISQEMIDRFFENKCSPEEVEAVVMFLKNNPGSVKSLIKKEDWDAIENKGQLPENLSEEMLEHIKEKLFADTSITGTHNLKILYFKWVAAASIIFLAGWWGFKKISSFNNEVVAMHQTIDTTATAAQPVAANDNWKIKFNTSKQPLKVLLQDGSVVTLYANSTIRYQDVFTNNKRDIFLDGEAFFEVAKDKSRPFTVFAGNLSTTALGTSFIVSAVKQKQYDIQVKLFTGKVVIRSTKKLTGWNKDTILVPGQQLTYQELKGSVNVSTFATTKNTVGANKAGIQKDELSFSNTALTEVLYKISELKQVKIQYSKNELKGMNFTGSINRKDDISVVLKVIAQMNGLQISQQGDSSFIIVKASK